MDLNPTLTKVLTTCLIVLVIFVIAYILVDQEVPYDSVAAYNSINFKTGDLILSRWHYLDSGYRMFSKYSHVGMVVVIKGKNYYLEIHPEESKDNVKLDNAGVHLYTLRPRLKEYHGTVYHLPLVPNSSAPGIDLTQLADKILTKMPEYKQVQFDTGFRNTFMLGQVFKMLHINYPDKESRFCSEFIAQVCGDIGIHEPDCLTWHSPATFTEWKEYSNDVCKITF